MLPTPRSDIANTNASSKMAKAAEGPVQAAAPPAGQTSTFDACMRAHRAPWATACVNETLRLFPPVAIDGRFCMADDELPSGRRVAAGTLVLVPNMCIGRSPHVYDHAESFRPQRWLQPRPQSRGSVAEAAGGGRSAVDSKVAPKGAGDAAAWRAEPLHKTEQYQLPVFWAGPVARHTISAKANQDRGQTLRPYSHLSACPSVPLTTLRLVIPSVLSPSFPPSLWQSTHLPLGCSPRRRPRICLGKDMARFEAKIVACGFRGQRRRADIGRRTVMMTVQSPTSHAPPSGSGSVCLTVCLSWGDL